MTMTMTKEEEEEEINDVRQSAKACGCRGGGWTMC